MVGGRLAGRFCAGLRHVLVDQMEGELGGLVDLALEVGRTLDARHLQLDAIVALANDGRLDGAGLVDAAAQDLDRLVDHFLLLAEQLLLGKSKPDRVALRRTPRARIDGAQRLDRLGTLGLLAQHHGHGRPALHGRRP